MTDEKYRELSKVKNYVRTFVLAAGGFYFGYYATCMNVLSKPILEGVLGYDPVKDFDQLNTLNGVVNLLFGAGAFVGVSTTGKISTMIGRRPMLYLGEVIALLNVIPSSIQGLAPLLICRILSGLVSGINVSIYSIVLAELLPNHLCGIGGALGNLFLALGMTLGFICQNIWTYEEITEYWRVFLIYPLIVSILRILLFTLLFKTDTPKYYFERENKRIPSKLNRVAARLLPPLITPSIGGIASEQIPSNQVYSQGATTSPDTHTEFQPSSPEGRDETGNTSPETRTGLTTTDSGKVMFTMEVPDTDTDRPLTTQEAEPEKSDPLFSDRPLLSLRKKKIRQVSESKRTKSVIISLFLMRKAYSYIYDPDCVDEIVQEQASFYIKEKYDGRATVSFRHLLGPKYRRQLVSGCFVSFALQVSGINFFMFYSTAVFDLVANNGKLMTLIVGISNIGGAVISTPMVAKLGRKINLSIGTSLQSVGMLMLAIGYVVLNLPLLIIGTIFYMAGFSIGLGGTQTTYVSEILPPNGVAVSFSIQWILDMVTGILMPFLAVWVGPLAMFIFFCVFNFVAVILMWLTCVETKDRSPEEIHEEFEKSWIHVCDHKTD